MSKNVVKKIGNWLPTHIKNQKTIVTIVKHFDHIFDHNSRSFLKKSFATEIPQLLKDIKIIVC